MTKHKCIFFVTNNYTPFSGGVVSSINSMVTALRAKNYDVYIITFDFTGNHYDDLPFVIRVPVMGRFMYKNNHIIIPRALAEQVDAMVQQYNPSIMHVHHPFLLAVAALKAAKKYGIPIVFTYHTIYEQYAHYIPLPACITKPMCTKLVMRFCNQVTAIIAPSTAIKRYLLSKKVTTPIHVLPSALQEHYIPTQVAVKTMTTPLRLLTVGRMAKEKNLFALIDLVALLHTKISCVAYIVGYGPEYSALCAYAYDTHKLTTSQIQFVYQPTHSQILELYQSCHLFLFTSQTDTQGIVLAEAMAYGMPVIALHGPGQSDMVKNHTNGFLADSIETMADYIVAIHTKEQDYQRMSAGALNTAKKYYPAAIVKTLEAIYSTLLRNMYK